MRIEPKIIDGKIEKKSLYEKSKQEKPELDPFDALFIDDLDARHTEDTLSKLEVIDDEDRMQADEIREMFTARDIGKTFVPTMDTQEVERASLMESYEELTEEYLKEHGVENESIMKELESRIRDAF